MATRQPRKKAALPAAEVQAKAALEAFTKKHEGRTLTDAQKAEKKALREALGKLQFVRIANKRVPKATAAIKAIGNLAGAQYVKTPAQVDYIIGAMESAVKSVASLLRGAKESTTSFSLPTDESGEKK